MAHFRQSVRPALQRKTFSASSSAPPFVQHGFADGLLVAAVGAGVCGVGNQDDCQNDAEYDCRQRVDLGADLLAGHRVDGDRQCLHRAGVEVGNHEVINRVGQADEECRQNGRHKWYSNF